MPKLSPVKPRSPHNGRRITMLESYLTNLRWKGWKSVSDIYFEYPFVASFRIQQVSYVCWQLVNKGILKSRVNDRYQKEYRFIQ